jgi:hypothetical protein
MSNSAPRFKGKNKKEIAAEAFSNFGKKATVQQVDEHFRKYGLPHCERSMYMTARREAEGRPALPRRLYPRYKTDKHIVGLVVRTKQLAAEMGGYDVLEELINALR